MWSWFGVGKNTLPIGGFSILPSVASRTERSTLDACIVQVPGTGLFGSGHCVATVGVVLQASGTNQNSVISVLPSSTPHSSSGRGVPGHGIASSGCLSLPNIGTST